MPLGGAKHPAFRGTGRCTRWLVCLTLLILVMPAVSVAAILLARAWGPMSGLDRAVFCMSSAAVVVSTVAFWRTRPILSWRWTLLLCGPVALSVYPFTHSLASTLSGIAMPLLFGWLGGGASPGEGRDGLR